MAKITKEDLMEKLKVLTPEDRALFRETLMEIEPAENQEILTGEEIAFIRGFYEEAKKKEKKKSKGNILESLFGGTD